VQLSQHFATGNNKVTNHKLAEFSGGSYAVGVKNPALIQLDYEA
jgi:hypothetical protein